MSVLSVSANTTMDVAYKLSILANLKSSKNVEQPLCVGSYLRRYNIRTLDDICTFVMCLDMYNDATVKARGDYHPQSYSESMQKENIEALKSVCNFVHPEINVFQLLKSLQCFEYNIDLEGYDATFTDEKENERYKQTLKILKDLIKALALHIVSYTNEYGKAKWG